MPVASGGMCKKPLTIVENVSTTMPHGASPDAAVAGTSAAAPEVAGRSCNRRAAGPFMGYS
jgi:hypothetical protein